MMNSVVLINVTIAVTNLEQPSDMSGGDLVEVPGEVKWSGSGVVYKNFSASNGDKHSLILTANHVLETPAIGSIEDIEVEFLGMKINQGKRRIESVLITATTENGQICLLEPLRMGDNELADVATGEVYCEAGSAAVIATSNPVKGEKVFVVGHPQGIKNTIVTEGYVSGTDEDGFLVLSAPAWGGNSGGPVFHDGKVIGLLVRGSRAYHHITMVTPLEELWKRIFATN